MIRVNATWRARASSVAVAIALAIASQLVAPARAVGGPPLTTRGGVVAADHAIASEVGAATLRRGGNAVDAAVATALALGVVNPASSGIGGGGFALVHDAATGEVRAYDFREVAPAGLDPDDFVRDGALDPLLARRGGLAVAVPGELAGLYAIQRRHGALSWRRVVTPAARLARDGFVVGEFLSRTAASVVPDLPADASFDPLRALLAPDGAPRAAGERLARPGLARVLLDIAAAGPAAFYAGDVAAELVATVAAAGGVLTLDDLAGYAPIERAPLRARWRDLDVVAMPAPSSGGAIVLEVLGILDALAARGVALAALGRGSADALHVVAEALAHGFADRARLFGADATAEAIARVLAPDAVAALAARIELDRAGAHDRYGHADAAPAIRAGGDGGTSHVCVIDAAGNAVALTTTVNGWYGSKLVTPSGIVLNNEIDDFALRAGVPNGFGLVQSEHNLVAAGERPLSSMSPTLVLDDAGRAVACVGGSGGPYIISAVVQVLLDVFVHGVDVADAIDAPRVHHQWLPAELRLEAHAPDAVRAELARRGHQVETTTRETAVQAIVVRPDGTRQAASDPRKGGAPAAEAPAAADAASERPSPSRRAPQ